MPVKKGNWIKMIRLPFLPPQIWGRGGMTEMEVKSNGIVKTKVLGYRNRSDTEDQRKA